jgi:hypothetical protein
VLTTAGSSPARPSSAVAAASQTAVAWTCRAVQFYDLGRP